MRRVEADREYGMAPSGYRLPDDTRPGRVRLQVSDLARSTEYYRSVLGLHVAHQDASRAQLGAAEADATLVDLHYERGTHAVPRGGTLGLYHFAILLPSRTDLGAFVTHLVEHGTHFAAADHLVSEAIYLWDPDGLGIEVYADRPRDAWRTSGRELMMTTERLDLRRLVDSAGSATWHGMPAGTVMGHVHLSVGDLDTARDFYHGGLGLETTVWYPGALFMAAGGYHHHLGTNTWAMGARTATAGDARLLEWELVLPGDADIRAAEESLRAAGYETHNGRTVDPWGTPLQLKSTA